MKILLVHNAYKHRGGEDNVFSAERDLLVAAGHCVTAYLRHNDDIAVDGFFSSAKLATQTIWSWESYRALGELLRESQPDIVHFHNILPLISPASYYACVKAGVPVVQTLHNYRLVCPGGMFLRDGLVCEQCLGRSIPWPGIAHACYRGSRAATSGVATMLTVHRALRTWQHGVNVYIALTEFARRKFIEGGLPRERIVVKPNFVSLDPGVSVSRGDYALFVGRLAQEKGLDILLSCWRQLSNTIPLKIAGDGPLHDEMESFAAQSSLKSVSFLGRVSSGEILELMRGARFLVFPSLWFEGFPLTIAEAYACGIPVVASRLGAMGEIVEDGRTGLHFKSGDAADLAAKVEWAWAHEDQMESMGIAARKEYESKYTAERNYQMLKEIYESAIRLRVEAAPENAAAS
jgi:glycosyltransferase involved in cell wall biosynthesis